MNPDPVVFAMANPNPEVPPEEAAPHVRVMATGRSDYPNQINNVLAFPGVFRGALDARAPAINEEMKLAAAQGIAAWSATTSSMRITSFRASSTAT
jgi:malate dehydrogenase (oxaloacetate-decarboxylating)